MHKRLITITVLICVITALLTINVSLNRKIIYRNTVEEIERQGYRESDIKNIKIDHSYLRRLLSYNELRIAVEFNKIEDIYFWFTSRKGHIIFEGIASEPMLDKEMIIYYSEQYKNGTLLD